MAPILRFAATALPWITSAPLDGADCGCSSSASTERGSALRLGCELGFADVAVTVGIGCAEDVRQMFVHASFGAADALVAILIKGFECTGCCSLGRCSVGRDGG